MWGHQEDGCVMKRGYGQGEDEEAANVGWSLCVKRPGYPHKAPNEALTEKSSWI